jgi:hypothetical protein
MALSDPQSGLTTVYGRVGPQTPGGDGTYYPLRLSKTGELVISGAHGKYAEAGRRGKLFGAANQAATTTTVGLATTYTGLVISNPAGSGVNLEILQVGVGLAAAPAAPSTIGLLAGWLAAGITAHTTPLTPFNEKFDLAAGLAKADAAATLVGTPTLVEVLMGGFTAATLPSVGPALIDVAGGIIVPPGGYCGIYTSTVASIFGSFTWEEVPLPV